MRFDRYLNLGAYAIISVFMVYGTIYGLFVGWTDNIQFVGWLPKGFRIVSAYPYSILVFGAFAFFLIKKWGWPAVFIVGLENELWELASVPQPSILILPPWPFYALMAIDLGLFAYVFLWYFKFKVEWKLLLLQFSVMWAYAIPCAQLYLAGVTTLVPGENYYNIQLPVMQTLPFWLVFGAEFFGEMLLVVSFFVIRPIGRKT